MPNRSKSKPGDKARGKPAKVLSGKRKRSPRLGQPLDKSIRELKPENADIRNRTDNRRRPEEDLREAQKRYRALIEASPDAVVVHKEGRLLYANPAALRLYGAAGFEELKDRSVLEFSHPEDREDVAARLKQAGKGETVPLQETRLIRLDGQQVFVEASAGLIHYEGAPAVLAIIRDITKRKEMEKALSETQKDLDHAQSVAHTGSWRLNVQRNELRWSDETHRIFGIPKETPLTYESFLAVVHPDDRSYVDQKWKAALRGEPYDIEHRIIVGTEVKWVREIAEMELDPQGGLRDGFGIVHDFTRRKQAEERLRQRTAELQQLNERLEDRVRERAAELAALSSELVVAQEKERKRISQDLHDHIWQALELIKIQIETFFPEQGHVDLEAFRTRAIQIVAVIRETVARVRSVQGDLWPPLLDDIGILATINWYCREFEKNHAGFAVEKQMGVTETEIPARIKIMIYRVMQEALKNAALHSGASRVSISLQKREEKITFAIADNGRGFDIERILFRTRPWVGFGLVAIRERVELSGGTFEVRSGEGAGTTIQASWPLTETPHLIPEMTPAKEVSKGPEEPFRMVTEAISDWVYAFRILPDGKPVRDWMTPGFTAVTGYPTDIDLAEIIHPEDRHVIEDRDQHIRTMVPHVSEYRIVTPEERICWVRDAITPVPDPLHPGTIKVIGAAQNITERKGTEESLRRSEQLFSSIFHTSPAATMLTLLADGKCVDANEAMARLLGYTREELIGKTSLELKIWLSMEERRSMTAELVQKGHLENVELVLRKKSGELINTLAAGETFTLDGRQYILSFFFDITERKRTEEALRQYELLSAHSRDIILFMKRDDGRILEANAAATRAYGYSRNELLGLTIRDLRAPGTRELIRDQMAEADVQGILFETVHRRKDGSTFAVEVSSRGASIADGRTLISVIRDITVRKEAEQGLRLSEKRYRSYIEVTGQLGWTTNADGEVVEDIPSWRQFTGQSENEVKGWGWSTAIHPDDLGHTVRAWGEAVATRSHYETEYRIRRNDGVYRYFLARGVPVYGDDGTIQEWVGTCIDITDRKRTEEELLKSREELEIRVQERTSDLAKANETLRHLSSRLLSAQEDERKRVAGELHDTIGSSLNGVRYKIEDLRQQIAKGSIVTAESLSSLTTVLQEGIEECRRMQQDLRPALLDDLGLLPTLSWFCRRYQTIYTGIQVVMEQTLEEADIPDSLKVVIFRITQEGMNNIAKHSKADLVRLSLGKKAAGIELVLKDNGQGFDPNKVPGLASAKWGLGLTSMKERAQLSGGILTVESAEGKGTTLRASWPSGRKKLPPSGLAS